MEWLANDSLTLILLTCRIWWAPNNANKWQMGFNSAFKGLTRRHFLLSRRRVKWIFIYNVQRYRWRCTIPWRCLEEVKQRNLARQWPLLFVQDLFIARQHLYNSLSSCCYALLLLNSVPKHPDACRYEAKPQSKLWPPWSPSLRSSSQLLPGHFASEFQQHRQSWAPNGGSSTVCRHLRHWTTNLRVWLKILGLGAKYVNVRDGLRMIVNKKKRLRN